MTGVQTCALPILIIKFFNNVAAQAVKAELNAKGVVFVNFKCGVVTSKRVGMFTF